MFPGFTFHNSEQAFYASLGVPYLSRCSRSQVLLIYEWTTVYRVFFRFVRYSYIYNSPSVQVLRGTQASLLGYPFGNRQQGTATTRRHPIAGLAPSDVFLPAVDGRVHDGSLRYFVR